MSIGLSELRISAVFLRILGILAIAKVP